MNCIEAGMAAVFLWASLSLALAQVAGSGHNAAYMFMSAAPVVAFAGYQAVFTRTGLLRRRSDAPGPALVELKARVIRSRPPPHTSMACRVHAISVLRRVPLPEGS